MHIRIDIDKICPGQNSKKKKKMKLALVIELCDFIKYGYGCWVEL